MRVTSEMMVTGSLRRLQGRLERYERAQVELSSGKRVQEPSDDPGQASRGLVLRAALRAREQELRASTDARGLVNGADSQLQSASSVLQRARDLTVRAANPSSPSERQAIAEELAQITESLQSIANTRHRDRPLFAGFQGTDPVAKVAGAWTYRGDDGAIVRRVSDQDRIQVNVTAEQVFGFGGAAGTDTFSMLDDLRTAVAANDTAGIQAGLDNLDVALDRVHGGLATIGAAATRVDQARVRTEESQLALRTELADVEDVDIAEAIMDLQVEEMAYQATLQALGRSLPATLVSFLR